LLPAWPPPPGAMRADAARGRHALLQAAISAFAAALLRAAPPASASAGASAGAGAAAASAALPQLLSPRPPSSTGHSSPRPPSSASPRPPRPPSAAADEFAQRVVEAHRRKRQATESPGCTEAAPGSGGSSGGGGGKSSASKPDDASLFYRLTRNCGLHHLFYS